MSIDSINGAGQGLPAIEDSQNADKFALTGPLVMTARVAMAEPQEADTVASCGANEESSSADDFTDALLKFGIEI